jgi:hypothetical protein
MSANRIKAFNSKYGKLCLKIQMQCPSCSLAQSTAHGRVCKKLIGSEQPKVAQDLLI